MNYRGRPLAFGGKAAGPWRRWTRSRLPDWSTARHHTTAFPTAGDAPATRAMFPMLFSQARRPGQAACICKGFARESAGAVQAGDMGQGVKQRQPGPWARAPAGAGIQGAACWKAAPGPRASSERSRGPGVGRR